MPPCPSCRFRITSAEVSLRNIPINLRLEMRLVPRVKQSFGAVSVPGFQALLAPGLLVLDVEDSVAAPVKAELIHCSIHVVIEDT